MEGLEVTSRSASDFWRGKRVLLTGHTGFKGAWLAFMLHRLGATVTGVALPPNSKPNLYSAARIEELCQSHFCDIRDAAAVADLIRTCQPDIVFHLAAQALVRPSYRDPLGTFATNIMGTCNVLDALRGLAHARVAVMVTTDKVYRNTDHKRPYREDDILGGHDPYSASKAASEIVIAGYRDAFLSAQGLAVASARAGNVIGGGDWSEDRIVPDMIRAWQSAEPMRVRRPQAVRPWQHVLEPLNSYLTLARKLWDQPDLAGAYNFGPVSDDAVSVRALVELSRTAYGGGDVHYEDGAEGPHESSWLSLDIAKAGAELGVEPRWRLPEAVSRTMAWYKAQKAGKDARSLCESDIEAYEKLP